MVFDLVWNQKPAKIKKTALIAFLILRPINKKSANITLNITTF